jgi:hypothetical protein
MRTFLSLPARINDARLTVIAGLLISCATPLHAHDLSLFDGTRVASIVYDEADGAPIAKVATLLAHDLI